MRNGRTEVLLVTECGYPWTVGGVSTWIHDLATGLPGRQLTVLSLAPPRVATAPPFLPRNVTPVECPVTPGEPGAALIARAVDLASAFEPEVVHASSSGVAGVAGVAISRACGAPLVVTEHGLAWVEERALRRGQPGRH